MISVIVPIYNVEHYLSKCLDSLTYQTFQDVEFILIDDGSTDKSGEIAEAFASRDNRFLVFHTANHGLSAARNLGIEKAHGDWIMFVDADDYVTPDFCETPYFASMRENADLVIFKYKSRPTIGSEKSSSASRIVDAETAIRDGGVVVWNKLYHIKLFDDIRYPEKRVHEDIATTHKLIFKAKRIQMLPEVLYYHTFRKGSIAHTRSLKNKQDAFWAELERAEFLKSRKCPEELYGPRVWSRALTLLAVSEPSDDPCFQKAEALVDSINGIPLSLNRKKELMLLVWKVDKRLFHFICRLLDLKDKRDMESILPDT